MLGAIATEALNKATQNLITVRFQRHIDEVDNNDSTHIAKAKLASNLFGRFQVVLGDGLFQVAALTDELTGVDVDNNHRFGAINDEGSTRW